METRHLRALLVPSTCLGRCPSGLGTESVGGATCEGRKGLLPQPPGGTLNILGGSHAGPALPRPQRALLWVPQSTCDLSGLRLAEVPYLTQRAAATRPGHTSWKALRGNLTPAQMGQLLHLGPFPPLLGMLRTRVDGTDSDQVQMRAAGRPAAAAASLHSQGSAVTVPWAGPSGAGGQVGGTGGSTCCRDRAEQGALGAQKSEWPLEALSRQRPLEGARGPWGTLLAFVW